MPACRSSTDPAAAQFALVSDAALLPPLDGLCAGHRRISRSLDHHRAGGRAASPARTGWWVPGSRISSSPTSPLPGGDFLAQWAENRARFPRGIDLLLVARWPGHRPAAHHPHFGGLSHVCCRKGRRGRHCQCPPPARRPPPRRPLGAGAAASTRSSSSSASRSIAPWARARSMTANSQRSPSCRRAAT